MGVDSTERVVQQVHLSVTVHGTGHTDTLLLAATQVDALKHVTAMTSLSG